MSLFSVGVLREGLLFCGVMTASFETIGLKYLTIDLVKSHQRVAAFSHDIKLMRSGQHSTSPRYLELG